MSFSAINVWPNNFYITWTYLDVLPLVVPVVVLVALLLVREGRGVKGFVPVTPEPLPATNLEMFILMIMAVIGEYLGEVVNPGELQDSGHAVEEAANDEPV